ncbi:outer membrane protein [Ciceribacter sp. sgz301302]
MLATTAAAADQDLAAAPEVTVSGAADSGVYLRIDGGYGAGSRFSPDAVTTGPATPVATGAAVGASPAFDEGRFGHPAAISGGIGYRVNDLLRADLTAEYFTGSIDGRIGGAGGSAVGIDFDAVGLMANAYADLGTVAGFTPYAGLGLGATRLDWSGMTTQGGLRSENKASDWRVTYALTAGVAYDVTERLTLDVNYRYSNIAGGTFLKNGLYEGKDDGLSRHEIRAGLRFNLW